jgi:hypothetical protein
MATPPRELTRCLHLNALALAFSLAHVMADYAIVAVQAGPGAWSPVLIVVVSSVAYGWWGWSMARAALGSRSGFYSLLVLSGVWAALLNGGSVVFTPITNVLADVIHFGCLLFGVWAAYTTWRLLRPSKAALTRAADAHI